MDWLRSEDLKEEENVTASITIIALLHFGVARLQEVSDRAVPNCLSATLSLSLGVTSRLPVIQELLESIHTSRLQY
jgi:hypothetical protein